MQNIWGILVRCVVFSGIAAGLMTGVATAVPQAAAQANTPRSIETFSNVKVTAEDHVLGRADAPVTIVEYASLTCGHCADFHNKVLPDLKKVYISTGKVRLVYRDFPLDRLALAGSVLARCFDREQFFRFIGILYQEQDRWKLSADPMKSLGQLARLGGMSPKKFSSCLKDKKLETSVLEQRFHGSKTFKIQSTPTLIINGQKFNGGLTFAQLKAVIDPMLQKN